MSYRITTDQFLVREPKETIDRVKRFLSAHREKTKASVFVVGLSGGLDSSVTAALCALAVGGARVVGISLPEKETRNERNLRDARRVAEKFRVRFKTIDITRLVDAAAACIPRLERRKRDLPYANIKARLRAMVLYYYANKYNGLVVGTGDKSEIMLGYYTKFGDGACDIQPLADMYKTSVRDLAKRLGIPKGVYSKPPSPELWPGQTAEGELGLEYDKLDMVLWGLERWMDPGDIAEETGLPAGLVRRVRERWVGSEHKRRPPLALKLGYRTAGQDLRLPYTMG
jgi:NAD+ synthase